MICAFLKGQLNCMTYNPKIWGGVLVSKTLLRRKYAKSNRLAIAVETKLTIQTYKHYQN